jgi:hypothetical protein
MFHSCKFWTIFYFLKPHSTIISKSDALSIQPIEVSSPDGKGSFYRCPLCPLSNAYYNIQANKVIDHINGNKHFGIAVRHRTWIICRCDDVQCLEQEQLNQSTESNQQQQQQQTIKPKAHRHCPHCGRLYSRRNEFLFHIERCCSSALNTSTTTVLSPMQKAQQKKQPNKQTNVQTCNVSNATGSNYVYLISTQASSQNIESMSNKRKLLNDIDLMDEASSNPKAQKCLVTSSMYGIDEGSADKVSLLFFSRYFRFSLSSLGLAQDHTSLTSLIWF